jgi:hypothetical protein
VVQNRILILMHLLCPDQNCRLITSKHKFTRKLLVVFLNFTAYVTIEIPMTTNPRSNISRRAAKRKPLPFYQHHAIYCRRDARQRHTRYVYDAPDNNKVLRCSLVSCFILSKLQVAMQSARWRNFNRDQHSYAICDIFC